MNRAEFIKKMFCMAGAAIATSSIGFAQEEQILRATPVHSSEGSIGTPGPMNVNPHFVSSGNGFGNRIAITFDDGPTPGVTDVVLRELDRRKLRATFFMIGKKVRQYPSLAQEVVAAGHEVANHTYTHPVLTKLPMAKVEDEINRCQDTIIEVTGRLPLWFRPPYGAFRKDMAHIPAARGMGIAYWSVDPQDWARPGSSIITSRVLNQTSPGSIILLHDLHQQTAQAVSDIFRGLEARAFVFSNMTRFLGHPYA